MICGKVFCSIFKDLYSKHVIITCIVSCKIALFKNNENKTFMPTVLFYKVMCLNLQKMNPLPQRMKYENIEGKNARYDQKASQHHPTLLSQLHKASNERVVEIKDQIIRAKAYLLFTPPSSTSHLAKELRLRIKEMERVVGEANKDSDLPRRYTLIFTTCIHFPIIC